MTLPDKVSRCLRDRLDKPKENLVALLAFLLLYPFISSKYIFEVEALNGIAFRFFMFTPLILFVNGFLFNGNRKKLINSLIFAPLTLGFLLYWMVTADFQRVLVCRYPDPSYPTTFLIGVYEHQFLSFHDQGFCRVQIRQRKILPGLLVNVKKLSNHECPIYYEDSIRRRDCILKD